VCGSVRTILSIRLALLSVLVGGLATSAGCAAAGGERPDAATDRLRVVATTMPLQEFARQVGGERVAVRGVLDADSEPHDYEPTPSDADAAARADVVVWNDAGLDDWLIDLLEQAGGDARRVVATRGIPLLPTEERGFPGDPHVWHDPELAKRMVDNIAAGFARADPAARSTYRANAARYKWRLDGMAATIRRRFADIPAARRNLVTSHDAFGYFARAYDVKVVGSVLPTVTTEAEPSARQIRRLIEDIRERRVRVVFTERGVDASLERRVAEEAGARVSTSLYADSLGPPGSGADTFIAAELANTRAMRSAWARGGR
jgi:zinc/manganese transport system substrate-binding protein